MAKLFPKQERPKVRQLYEEGYTIPNIASSYCVTYGTIKRAILAAGGKIRNAQTIKNQLKELKSSYDSENDVDKFHDMDTIHDEFQGKIWY